MKTNLTSVEIMYLVEELKLLEQAKVDSIFHPEKEELYLVFHVPTKGKHILKYFKGSFCFITSQKRPHQKPSGFCLDLRRHILNARITAITQCESERILKIELEKEEKMNLYIELFAKGNIILTKKDNSILAVLKHATFKERVIRPKEIYSHPVMPINIFKANVLEIQAITKKSIKTLVKCLATEIGIGGTYAEEVCLLTDLPKTKKASELNKEQSSSLAKKIKEVLSKKSTPLIISEEDEVIDVIPINLELYKDYSQKTFKSYSEALDSYCTSNLEIREKTPKEKVKEKLQRMQKTQKKHLEQIEIQSKEEQDKGELIYSKYQLLQELVGQINKAKQEMTLQEMKKKLKNHKLIKDLDPKDKTITVELE
ncbi:MAG: NFACT family protein [Nanoarchaeota archaeon]|nr:NFACT family protein [Nanoarchaeota archaeon]